MTIAQAFNEIAVTHGGTASTSGTIAGAIDALNDALAGSDQPAACTIEAAVRLLGEHIGGGSQLSDAIQINLVGLDVYEESIAGVYCYPSKQDYLDGKYMFSAQGHGELEDVFIPGGLFVHIYADSSYYDYDAGVKAELYMPGSDTPIAFTDFVLDPNEEAIEFIAPRIPWEQTEWGLVGASIEFSPAEDGESE